MLTRRWSCLFLTHVLQQQVTRPVISHHPSPLSSQSNKDTGYLSRHVALRVGVPDGVPCLTVNRLCGSGFQAVVSGAQDILLGDAEVALVGGSENMSEAPFAVRDVRFGTRFGMDYKFEDVLWGALTDHHVKLPMGITAENLAEQYAISREECDEFALRSQTLWRAAHEAGKFVAEMAPVAVQGKKGPETMEMDEHPRAVTLQAMGKLPPVFKKNGTVTAANASVSFSECGGDVKSMMELAENAVVNEMAAFATMNWKHFK